PILFGDTHAFVRNLHVPAGIQQGTAGAVTQKVDQELDFASYTVFAPVCPEASQPRVGHCPGNQVVRNRSDRVVAAQAAVQGFCLAHVWLNLPCVTRRPKSQSGFSGARASIPRTDCWSGLVVEGIRPYRAMDAGVTNIR